MNKFKREEVVTFQGDNEKYKIVRFYTTDSGYKYDIISLDGKRYILAMPQEVLQDTYSIKSTVIDPEAANLPKWRKDKDESFPEGMDAEVVRLGKKSRKKPDET